MKSAVGYLASRFVLIGILLGCCCGNLMGKVPPGFDPMAFLHQTYIGLTGDVALPDGQPATGAIVELINGSEPETSTTVLSDGSFGLPFPSAMAGFYSVRIRKTGFATYKTIDLPMERNLPKITLRPAEIIRGQIVSSDNKPLPDVQIVVSTVFGRTGPRREYQKIDYKGEPPYSLDEKHKTDAAGRFEFNDLCKGFYAVQAYGPGLISVTQEIETPMTSAINITMTSATGAISGRTIRFGSNEPLPGTTVSISRTRPPAHGPMLLKGQTVVSDYDGNFRFTGVEPGYYSVRGRRDGLTEIIDSCGADLRERETAQVDVKMYAGHSVSGIVRDGVTSEPLAGVLVSASAFYDDDTTATTDANGHYTINHTFACGGNRLFIQFKKKGYAYASTSGGGREIPDLVLDMDKLAVRLDVPMFPKKPGEYDGFFH